MLCKMDKFVFQGSAKMPVIITIEKHWERRFGFRKPFELPRDIVLSVGIHESLVRIVCDGADGSKLHPENQVALKRNFLHRA